MERVQNPVEVFCRLRPLVETCDISTVEVRDSTTILLIPPGNGIKLNQVLDQETHYVFKKVFGNHSTQKKIFEDVARPLVGLLVQGFNSLLFTYGVTGSGKTFTMTGTEDNCGILPRCLKTIFQTIDGCRAPKSMFQPDHLNGFEIASEPQMRTLTCRETLKSSRTIVMRRKNSDLDFNLESIESSVVTGINPQNLYAVFVSYIEVYNNSVYDLLEDLSLQKPLQSRIVREDCNHNMYVHGATELEVSSIYEAIDAFRNGQKRKRMGQTALNAESSRSHSVFNIRLVQAPSKEFSSTKNNTITISQLSLVDLAGSERSSRTKNSGARLREAGNINNSLMKLRECLEYMRDNQKVTNGSAMKKIPYRDSKLTYLFKNFFEGEGQVSMIVCVNPNKSDFAENMQVLKFAEITQEVQIVKTKSQTLDTPLKRQAWNEENTIPSGKTIMSVTKIERDPTESPSLIKKPIPYFGRTPTQQSFLKSARSRSQLDFNYSKIMELEKENFELRLELNKLRKAYERITGQPLNNKTFHPIPTSIFATPRKPLILSQKSKLANDSFKLSPSLQKSNKRLENLLLCDPAVKTAFDNELKKKLQQQRRKLEQIQDEVRNDDEKAKQLLHLNAEESQILCENGENKVERESTVYSKEKVSLEAVEDHSKNVGPEINTSSILPGEKEPTYGHHRRLEFEECIQMDVFASFKMMTPKRHPKSLEHSTPYQKTSLTTKRQHDIFNESLTPRNCKSLRDFTLPRDPDFDKREKELSLKMEMHRKKQRGNRRLMDILYGIRRVSGASNLLNVTLSRKNSFQVGGKELSLSDGEL